MRLLAIDPGKEKCGLAVVEGEKVVLKRLLSPSRLFESLNDLLLEYRIEKIILGDRTFSRQTRKRIEEVTEKKYPLILVDEHLSTQEARRRYWRENPPKGWRSLIPLTLQTPPEPYDHYVAVILAERYLSENLKQECNS